MQEVLKYLRPDGYKTYIVTGRGQDFVRVYSEEVYGIPARASCRQRGAVKFGYEIVDQDDRWDPVSACDAQKNG